MSSVCFGFSGPTVSSFESIQRVNAMGDVSKFYTGLGRPQGLAFDAQGNLYVAASLRGRADIARKHRHALDLLDHDFPSSLREQIANNGQLP